MTAPVTHDDGTASITYTYPDGVTITHRCVASYAVCSTGWFCCTPHGFHVDWCRCERTEK